MPRRPIFRPRFSVLSRRTSANCVIDTPFLRAKLLCAFGFATGTKDAYPGDVHIEGKLTSQVEPSTGSGVSLPLVRYGLLAAVFIAAAISLWLWSVGGERRAVAALDDTQRHELFIRTKQNVESVCTVPPWDLRDYCEHQAEFLANFPECDGNCQTMVARQLAHGRAVR